MDALRIPLKLRMHRSIALVNCHYSIQKLFFRCTEERLFFVIITTFHLSLTAADINSKYGLEKRMVDGGNR